MTLWQVTADYFCAGIIMHDGICVDAAPILRWTVGRRRLYLRGYFARRQWAVKYVAALGGEEE
jgi:hypothetical protein